MQKCDHEQSVTESQQAINDYHNICINWVFYFRIHYSDTIVKTSHRCRVEKPNKNELNIYLEIPVYNLTLNLILILINKKC